MFNSNESDGTYFKRFVTNPTISIEYDHAPNQPTSWDAKAGSTDLGCATTTPYPLLGKTDSVSSVVLSNKVSDPDGDSTQTTYQYWVNGSGTKYTLNSANGVANNGTASANPGIPASFTQGLADGTTVDWQITSVSDGHLSTSPSSGTVCHFIAYPKSSTIQLTVKSSGAENTPATIAASSSSSDPAVKFVYALDVPPPTSNAPASETLSGSQVSGGSATITTVPMGPGTHTLYAIGYDAAGNASPVDGVSFNVASAPGHTYSSLAAAFNNTAVSDQSNTAGGDMDGEGDSLSLQDLRAAGWASSTTGQGAQVAVDGASISLPAYGSAGGNGHDNVLADNQTITFPSSTEGDALVVLATSADGLAPRTNADQAYISSPHTPAGMNIAGADCTLGNYAMQDCTAPTGTLTYSDGTTSTYDLNVPDWADSTATGLSVITLPHYNKNGTANNASPRYIYAFAIHLTPGLSISSITLPDVSGPANPGTTAAADPTTISGNTLGSPIAGVPAIHILGMGVRHATTDASGTTWTGAWSSSAENQYAYTGNTHFTQQTFRTAITPSVSGTGVRVHLSNQLGKTPLTISRLTVAPQSSAGSSATTTAGGGTIATAAFSPVPASTPVAATFGGSTSVTIPAGGDIYTDPISGLSATAGAPLLVSAAVADAPTVEGHLWATGAHTWVTAKNAGDQTMDSSGTPFTASGALSSDSVNLITGLDTVTSGKQKTVAVLGDGLYAPTATGTKAVTTASGPRVSEALANALAGQSTVPDFGVVNTGIENNSLTLDIAGNGGYAALSRIDRDVLSEPGLQTVVLDQGLVDALNSSLSADQITTAYQTLQNQLTAWGIKVVYTTLTPCGSYSACTTTAESVRAQLNSQMVKNWPSSTPGQTATVATENTDAAVSNDPTATPEVLKTSDPGGTFDSGDHINLTPYANATMAQASTFNLADLIFSTVPGPATALAVQDHWGLSDGSGSSATDDASGNNLSLTNTGWGSDTTLPTADTSQKTTNPQGTDLTFDGSTSYATCSVPLLTTNQSFEINAWVKLATLSSADQTVLSESSGTAQAFTLGYSGASKNWTVSTLTAAGKLVTMTGGAATAGAWTHLRVTYDQPSGLLTLYVNGISVGVSSNTSPVFDTNGTFSVGAQLTTGSTTPTAPFQGAMSDISLAS